MRITILNKFYLPDNSPTARLVASLAQDRARRGDEVTVVTSNAAYAAYAADLQSTQTQDAAAVQVHRLWSPRTGRSTWPGRCLEYVVFFALACWKLLRLPKQDVVIVTTSPPWIAWAAVLHKWQRGCDVVLWNMDSYPEVLEGAGLLRRGGWAMQTLQWMTRQMFQQVSHTVCLDAAMREMLTYQYSPPGAELETTVIPNWEPVTMYADDVVVSHTAGAGLNCEEPVDADGFTVLYAGNMGLGHEFDTVLKAAQELSHSGVCFRFNGQGMRRQEISLAKQRLGLENVSIEDYKSHAQLLNLMGVADCALITLREEMLGMVSPSKLHASLAMGLPVLYIGPEGSNVDEAIRSFKCGASLRPGDAMGVVDFIARLMEDPAYHAMLASRARRAFLMAYCDHQALPQFDEVLRQVSGAAIQQAGPQQRAA